MRWLTQQAPEPCEVAAWHGCSDVLRRVPQVDGVDFGVAVGAKQTGREREDAAAVGSGGLGEDTDYFVWIGGG